MSPSLPCPSLIQRVCVHARGALITRALTLPAQLPSGPCELVVGGLSAQAEPSSLRVELVGGRQVVSLRSELHFAPRVRPTGGASARLQAAREELLGLEAEASHVQQEREALQSVDPRLRLGRLETAAAQRTRDALAAGALLRELLEAADARVLELTRARRRLEREIQDLEAARAGQPQGALEETRQVVLGLRGQGQVSELRLSYVVEAARWWPAYCARLEAGGRAGTWALDALVAQASGEDWSGVELSLSTADLIADARLPELPALRLGKAQPPRPKGYRPPPEGLDALFAGYDAAQGETRRQSERKVRALGGSLSSRLDNPFGSPEPQAERASDRRSGSDPGSGAYALGADADYFDSEDELDFDGQSDECEAGAPSVGFGGPPPPPSMPPLGVAMSRPMPSAKSAPPPEMRKRSVSNTRAGGGVPGGGGGIEREEAPPELVSDASEEWLDFDRLRLAAHEQAGLRGRLRRDPVRRVSDAGRALLAQVAEPSHARDPLAQRGSFDVTFSAQALCDVPSGVGLHRVGVQEAAVEVRQVLSTSPGQDDAVYREAELVNPLESPLLGGPLDVYLDGSLLTSTGLDRVGRGGLVRFGLGVEERVRVARNVRVREETSGLIGKTTTVHHAVRIELKSALPSAAPLRVLDRVPVAADDVDDVTVVLVGTSPPAKPYDQLERGEPVKGGLVWELELQPGQTRELSLDYRLELPAKREIAGGNRRD